MALCISRGSNPEPLSLKSFIVVYLYLIKDYEEIRYKNFPVGFFYSKIRKKDYKAKKPKFNMKKGIRVKFSRAPEDERFTLNDVIRRNIFSLAIIEFLTMFQIMILFVIDIGKSFKLILMYYNAIIFLLVLFLMISNIFYRKTKKINKGELKFKIEKSQK
jgi:hypothetical protein